MVSNELKKLKIPFKQKKVIVPGNLKYQLVFREIHKNHFDPKIIIQLNEKFNIPKTDYNFLFKISSRFDIGGFTLPEKVKNAICTIGGAVEISVEVLP